MGCSLRAVTLSDFSCRNKEFHSFICLRLIVRGLPMTSPLSMRFPRNLIALILVNRFKNFQHNLRNYRITIGLYAFSSPIAAHSPPPVRLLPSRNGTSVQSGGKPIISATNRGLSWESLPVWYSPGSILLAIIAVNALPFWLLGLNFFCPFIASFAQGVGNIAAIR